METAAPTYGRPCGQVGARLPCPLGRGTVRPSPAVVVALVPPASRLHRLLYVSAALPPFKNTHTPATCDRESKTLMDTQPNNNLAAPCTRRVELATVTNY